MQAQTYLPLPDSNAIWRIDKGDITCYFLEICSQYQYQIGGDTLINSITYKKLIKSGLHFPQPLDSNTYYFYNEYAGCFRNDIVAKKVFFIPPLAPLELLLYDFNLNIGDTVNSYLTQFSAPIIVSSVDSVYLGNVFRKRLNLVCCFNPNSVVFIEGIGSTAGLIEQFYQGMGFEGGTYLVCFRENNQTVYPDSNTSCSLITSIEKPNEHYNNFFTLFPNPATDFINISFSSTTEKNVSVEVYDLFGREVFEKELPTSNSKLQTEIDMRSFSNGIYIVEIKTGEGIYRQKVVKE